MLHAAYDLCLIKTAGSNRDLQHGNSYVIVSTTYTVFRKKVGLSRPTFVVDHVFTTAGSIFFTFSVKRYGIIGLKVCHNEKATSLK